MATIRKNPGNPFKVATKMLKSATGRVKTAVKNTQKTSTRKTTSSSSAPVTGKSRVNTKLMDAATKNLPNVTVKANRQPAKAVKPTYERGQSKLFTGGRGSKSTYYASKASIPSDSLKFMQQMAATNPAAAKSFEKFMKQQQAKNPGARFNFSGSQSVEEDYRYARPGERPKNVPGKKGKFSYVVPQVTTLIPKKKGKK